MSCCGLTSPYNCLYSNPSSLRTFWETFWMTLCSYQERVEVMVIPNIKTHILFQFLQLQLFKQVAPLSVVLLQKRLWKWNTTTWKHHRQLGHVWGSQPRNKGVGTIQTAEDEDLHGRQVVCLELLQPWFVLLVCLSGIQIIYKWALTAHLDSSTLHCGAESNIQCTLLTIETICYSSVNDLLFCCCKDPESSHSVLCASQLCIW